MVPLVLVADDDPGTRDVLCRHLERAGCRVLSTGRGREALRHLEQSDIDLALVDLDLPDVLGDEVLRVAHERDLPIVVLTARAGVEDRIAGLEQGADDCVTKPFSPREVVLRVQAVLRRASQVGMPDRGLSFGRGRLQFDRSRHEAHVGGALVALTPTEWRLLETLAATPGRVFSRYELVNAARGYEFDGDDRSIDSHIRNLRRKVERDRARPEIVETVPGVGYRLGLTRDG